MILGTGGGMALPDGKDASGRKQKVCLIFYLFILVEFYVTYIIV